MSNGILLVAFLLKLVSECFGMEKCGYVSATNGTFSVVRMKKPLPPDNDCGHDINFKYVYEGPATLWEIQNKNPFLYINIPVNNSTKCYFLHLKEHKMKRCYVNNFWKVDERLIVFSTYNPSKEAFVGEVNKYMKYGCENKEKMEAFFNQCVHHRVLAIKEYSTHMMRFYEEEKIHYQLHATAGHKDIKLAYVHWIILNTVILLKFIFS